MATGRRRSRCFVPPTAHGTSKTSAHFNGAVRLTSRCRPTITATGRRKSRCFVRRTGHGTSPTSARLHGAYRATGHCPSTIMATGRRKYRGVSSLQRHMVHQKRRHISMGLFERSARSGIRQRRRESKDCGVSSVERDMVYCQRRHVSMGLFGRYRDRRLWAISSLIGVLIFALWH